MDGAVGDYDDPCAAGLGLIGNVLSAYGYTIHAVIKSRTSSPADFDERAAGMAILALTRLHPIQSDGFRSLELNRLAFWCARLDFDFQRTAVEYGLVEFVARESLAFAKRRSTARRTRVS